MLTYREFDPKANVPLSGTLDSEDRFSGSLGLVALRSP